MKMYVYITRWIVSYLLCVFEFHFSQQFHQINQNDRILRHDMTQ